MMTEAIQQALAEIEDITKCRCTPIYTDRGLRNPDCNCDSAEALETLRQAITTLTADRQDKALDVLAAHGQAQDALERVEQARLDGIQEGLQMAANYHLDIAQHDNEGLEYSSLVGVPISNAEELRKSVEHHEGYAEQILKLGGVKKALSEPRCAECDCEKGGADCNWIAPPKPEKTPDQVWICTHMGEYGCFYPNAVEAEGEHGGEALEYVRLTTKTAASEPNVDKLIRCAQSLAKHLQSPGRRKSINLTTQVREDDLSASLIALNAAIELDAADE